MVNPLGRHVGRDYDHVQAVDLFEFKGFSISCTGHAGELVINTEVILEGGAGQGLALRFNADAFFGFDGLMVTFTPATTRHGTAGVFVNDDDLVTLHDVLHILLEHDVRTHRGVDVVEQHQITGGIQAVTLGQHAHFSQDAFDALHAGFGELDRPLLFVKDVVAFAGLVFDHFSASQLPGNGVHRLVHLAGIFGGARNHQRRPGFVDQDRIHLVHDGKAKAALNPLLYIQRHVVAQIVKTKFVVGTVGDVAGVGGFLFFRALA